MPTERGFHERGLAALLIAALSGALFALPAARPQLWPLAFVGIAVLAWQVVRARPGRAALVGWCFGIGWLLGATWWLFISMHRYGGLSAPLAALAVLALAAALSAYLAVAMALFARWRVGRARADVPLFAALWLAAELARGVLFTGFPWAATGYGQVDAPLAALAPWVGVYGVGAAVAALSVAPMLAGSRRRGVAAAVAAAAVVAAASLARVEFTTSTGMLGVTLVQTNVAQDEKFAPERLPAALDWLETVLHGARGPLVVAPETAIPLLPDQLGEAAWQRITGPFTGAGATRAALIGLPLGSFEQGYTNSVAGLAAGTGAGYYRYDKQHLVPFGEFIPPGFRWFTEMMNIPLGDFARGPRVPPSFVALGQRIGPNICYEDLFGEELARRFVDAARAPTVLVNLSNIGWFGDTIAIDQHLHISRLRSLELQRPMLRATNTGATAAIDHRGAVIAQLPPFVRGMLDVEIEGREGSTPYARWAGAFGLWPLVALSAALLVVARAWTNKVVANANDSH